MPSFARHKITATTADGFTFQNISGGVTMDEGWEPFIQSSLTCAAPDAETLELLDPRQNVRVKVTLNQDFGDGWTMGEFNAAYAGLTMGEFNALYAGKLNKDFNREHIHAWNSDGYFGYPTSATFDLRLRSRVVDHATGEMVITLSSDEAILEDYALVSNTPAVPPVTSVRAAVAYVLSTLGATLQIGTDDATIATEDLESVIWQPGVTAWEYLSTLTQKGNLRLWCDGERKWWLTSALNTVPGLVTLTAANNVTAGTDTIDLQGNWYDAVVIKYSWIDDLQVTQVAYDSAGPEQPVKVLTLEYDRAYPGPGAAANILRRALGRGRVLDVSAMSDYSAEPGKAITISLPDILAQTGFVSSVSWAFPGDEMHITSRGLIDTPETAWIFDPEGVSWADVPAGTDWTEDI